MFGNYLSQIDWHLLDQLSSCSKKNDLFTGIIITGLNYIMPEKALTFHDNDRPWITEDLKHLINALFPLETLLLSSFIGTK